MTVRRVAPLLAVSLLALPLGGCHVLLLFPCLAGCSTLVYSLPPRNDPLARALTQGSDINKIDAYMTTVSRIQLAALGGQWPQAPDCTQMAAVDCRYSIPVRVTRLIIMKSEPGGCGMMDVAVLAGSDGLPEVRRSGFLEMECPPEPSRSPVLPQTPPE
ncbi:MAG TPA: hypothetical protein VEC60_10480 [Reyranella sp.]|nr:hypothetical protein [Reyranella sp.]